MNYLARLFVYLLITLLCVSYVGDFSVYAQEQGQDSEENELCFRASDELQQYVDFSHDMISMLNTIEIEEKDPPQFLTPGGVFSSKVLQAPVEMMNYFMRMAPTLSRDVKRATGATLSATFTSLTSISEFTFQDSWMGLSMLFRKDAFARDLESMQDISNTYQEIMADAVLNQYWTKSIGQEMATKIDALMQQYTGEDKFFLRSSISANTKYNTLLNILSTLSNYMKKFIAIPQKNDSYFVKFLEKRQQHLIDKNESVTLLPNMVIIKKMAGKYNNIRGGMTCITSLQDFLVNIKKIKGIGKDAKESRDMMGESIKRLRNSLLGTQKSYQEGNTRKDYNGIDEILTEQQRDILRSVYGIDTTRITKSQALGLADIFSNSRGILIKTDSAARKIMDESIKTIHDAVVNVEDIFHGIIIHPEEENMLNNAIDQLKYSKHTIKKQYFRQTVDHTLSSILEEHKKANLFVQSNEIKSVTHKFVELGDSIHKTRELIGTKQSQDSINSLLDELCQKQCSNKGNALCRGNL